jgi:alpha-N-arabinofuranosidase
MEVTAIESGREAGLRQDEVFLPLHRESDYRISFRCRGKDLASGFALSVREGARTLARAAFGAPPAAWEERSAEMTILKGSVRPGTRLTCAIEVLSPGTLEIDLIELFPMDSMEGFDRDVVRECRAARLPLLRYPGGNFSSGYHWQDGVGPRALRPMRRNPAWDVPEYNHVGTDEFMTFCRLVGCEPMICINGGNGTPEEAAAWVEYANGPVTSAMGQMRAGNGHPEPYGVRIWEIGNELYGDWQIGHTTAEGYAERYLRFTKAMSAVDPSLVFVANGNDPAWNKKVLERCGAAVRSLSAHPLIGGGTPRGADPEKTFRALMAYATGFEREVRGQLAWASERGLSPKVAVTELQIFSGEPSNATLSEALFLGRFIHAAIRLQGAVELITHSALVNHGGCLMKRGEVVVGQPVQHAHVLYGTMSGVRPVPVEVTCSSYSTRESHILHVDGAPDLDAVALLDGTGAELTVVVINTHPRDEIAAEIVFEGAQAKPIRARRVGGPSFLTRNSDREPFAACLRAIDVPRDAGGKYCFPPHSITEIVFEP